eukprot:scaffold17580_cov95-Phaeocystis_antarctica.AAC.6
MRPASFECEDWEIKGGLLVSSRHATPRGCSSAGTWMDTGVVNSGHHDGPHICGNRPEDHDARVHHEGCVPRRLGLPGPDRESAESQPRFDQPRFD